MCCRAHSESTDTFFSPLHAVLSNISLHKLLFGINIPERIQWRRRFHSSISSHPPKPQVTFWEHESSSIIITFLAILSFFSLKFSGNSTFSHGGSHTEDDNTNNVTQIKTKFSEIKALIASLKQGKREISGGSQCTFLKPGAPSCHSIINFVFLFLHRRVSLFSFLSENTPCRKCCVSSVFDSLIPSFAFDHLISFSSRLYIVWMIINCF